MSSSTASAETPTQTQGGLARIRAADFVAFQSQQHRRAFRHGTSSSTTSTRNPRARRAPISVARRLPPIEDRAADGEAGALTEPGAARLHAPAMQLHQLAHQVRPMPSRLANVWTMLALPKEFEHLGKSSPRFRAVVAHLDLDLPPTGGDQFDAPRSGCIGRVVEEFCSTWTRRTRSPSIVTRFSGSMTSKRCFGQHQRLRRLAAWHQLESSTRAFFRVSCARDARDSSSSSTRRARWATGAR